MHRTQPLAMHRCPVANTLSTAGKCGQSGASVEAHFMPQFKDPNLFLWGVKYKKSEAYLRTTDVRIAKQFQEKLICV